GMPYRQMEQVGRDRFVSRRLDGERELAALIQDRRAISPLARQHRALAAAPFGERAHDPGSALAKCRFDFADGYPARGSNGKARQADLHDDRAPARTCESITDV